MLLELNSKSESGQADRFTRAGSFSRVVGIGIFVEGAYFRHIHTFPQPRPENIRHDIGQLLAKTILI